LETPFLLIDNLKNINFGPDILQRLIPETLYNKLSGNERILIFLIHRLHRSFESLQQLHY